MTSCIKVIPDYLKMQEMCNEVFHIEPRSLVYVLDHFKTQEMCDKAMGRNPCIPGLFPDRFKTQICGTW